MSIETCLLVGVSVSENDNAVLIVGQQDAKGQIKVINAFGGTEAIDLYNKLITKISKEKENDQS